jgi:NADH-quinone oxidoreductase subunit G
VPKVIINNQEHEIEGAGRNLLDVCLSLGYDVPYFCWHPAMHSIGACRQCAVKQFKDENDTRGSIVMACMTPATDGVRISTDDPQAVAFRKSVIEWLMVNHPHDCPICDEGGECHLQDMTVMTGHDYRRYRFTKRTHRNQDLGPFVNHEMNRCIQCYRCVRFYRDYAGGRDFEVHGWHDNVYFGRFQDGPLENEFSGNLVEICPTGVFTDKTLKEHYTRKWDMQQAPSVCVHCGLGCNIFAGERYGKLRRIQPRFNDKVNGYFLCDRGRYGYGFVNSPARLRQARMRNAAGTLEPCSVEEAVARVLEIVKAGKVVGIGSARATLEANFSLRHLVDPAHFHHGMSERTYDLVHEVMGILRCATARAAAMQEVARDDAALVLGEDVTNGAPLLALALRQTVLQKPMREARALKIDEFRDSAIREAIQSGRGPLYILTPDATKLDDQTPNTFRAAPADIARFGFAVAHAIDADAPVVDGLDDQMREGAERCAAELMAAECPVIVSGFTCGQKEVLHAAANVAWALGAKGKQADLFYTMPECNSMGVALLGGKGLHAALEAVRSGAAETLIILENDLTRQMDVDLAHEMLERAKHVIVIDHLPTPTAERAEIVLPAATFAESLGTLVNNEGRGQRLVPVYPPPGDVRDSWRWLGDIMTDIDKRGCETWRSFEGVMRLMAETVPAVAKVTEIMPPPDFREIGQKIPREAHRYSGRTAMNANVSVHEPKPPDDPETPLSYSMEGYAGMPPASLITRVWAPGWNSAQALNKYQTRVGGPLRGGDPGVRLIEPANEERAPYFPEVPEAFARRDDMLLIMPDYLIYGSEPLSMKSKAVASRAPEPYLGMSPADMELLEVDEGEDISVRIGGTMHHLRVAKRPALPDGVATLPAGLDDLSVLSLPEWGRVRSKRDVWISM